MKVQIELVNPKPIYTRRKGSTNTTCRKCSKTLDRQGQCCKGCVEEEKKQRLWKNRDVKVCIRKGCNNKPTFSSSLCKKHQKERHLEPIERLNQIMYCVDCGCELGKRKDLKKRTKYCEDCKRKKQYKHNEKWRKNNKDWINQYYKEYYSTPKWIEYRNKTLRKYTLYNNTCQIEGCDDEIGFNKRLYCDTHSIMKKRGRSI